MIGAAGIYDGNRECKTFDTFITESRGISPNTKPYVVLDKGCSSGMMVKNAYTSQKNKNTDKVDEAITFKCVKGSQIKI